MPLLHASVLSAALYNETRGMQWHRSHTLLCPIDVSSSHVPVLRRVYAPSDILSFLPSYSSDHASLKYSTSSYPFSHEVAQNSSRCAQSAHRRPAYTAASTQGHASAFVGSFSSRRLPAPMSYGSHVGLQCPLPRSTHVAVLQAMELKRGSGPMLQYCSAGGAYVGRPTCSFVLAEGHGCGMILSCEACAPGVA